MNHPIRFLSQSAPTMKKADRPAPMPLATQKSASPGVPALTLAFLAWLATPWDSTETGSPKYRGLDLFFRLHAGPAPRWPGAVKALFWCLAAVGACLLLGRLG